ncbi:MAG: DUF2188 domain-containing protein [Crocinitomicaceae bacterium]
MDNYFLQNNGSDWELKKEGNSKASKTFKDMNKTEATQAAAQFMKNHSGSLKIRKLDGKFEEERTYPKSKDPKKSKG